MNLADENLCTGCAACMAVCKRSAISLVTNKEGFVVRKVDAHNCVGCGECLKVCPIVCGNRSIDPLAYFAARSKSEDVLSRSTSGGVFYEVAKHVIESGGVVVGAILSKPDMVVKHVLIDHMDDLPELCKSKYVQSDVSSVYDDIREALAAGRKVLFSGTPCQTAGMRNVFREHPNLFLVAIICHSVSSQSVFSQWIEDLHETHGSKVADVLFREKNPSWMMSECVVRFEDGSAVRMPYREQPMRKCMDVCSRMSCISCKARNNNSGADLLIGDFWGVSSFNRDMDDDKGCSAVMALTARGLQLLQASELKIIESSRDAVLYQNPGLVRDVGLHKRRHFFLSNYKKIGVERALARIGVRPLWYRVARKMYRAMRFAFANRRVI